MLNNDLYYQKYLKYKTKYFDLIRGGSIIKESELPKLIDDEIKKNTTEEARLKLIIKQNQVVADEAVNIALCAEAETERKKELLKTAKKLESLAKEELRKKNDEVSQSSKIENEYKIKSDKLRSKANYIKETLKNDERKYAIILKRLEELKLKSA